MPNALMMADSNFPRFTGGESTEQKINTIQNYLFRLTEQLRWSYANIGKENFNETAFQLISEEIQGPVIKRYESLDLKVVSGEGNTASVQITGDGLKTEARIIEFKGLVSFKDLKTEGSTIISGSNIKTGIIKSIKMDSNEITGGTITGTNIFGANFYCTMDDNKKRTGDIMLCYPDVDTVVGGLQINDDGDGTTTESKKRIYLYAQKGFVLKLYSNKNISIEAANLVYTRGYEVTIEASRINLKGNVYVNGTPYTPATA